MTLQKQIIAVLDRALALKGRGDAFGLDTPLLGALPELDSMAVLAVITALEEQYGFVIHDDEIAGATFATLGSLVNFVEAKLRAA